jgi:GxxExxY protein
MEFDELSRNVIGCAIEVHRNLGPGLLESTYQQCLACELSHARIPFQMELPLPVRYKDLPLDCGYRIDLLVSGDLIVEIKSVETLLPIHQAQILTYMRQGVAWLAYQFQRHKAAKRHQTFRSAILRALRVLRGG